MRVRRPLYEALLRLEAEGAAVVDRQLRGEDIALSADTCCCIWTEDGLKVCHPPNMQDLRAVTTATTSTTQMACSRSYVCARRLLQESLHNCCAGYL